MQSQQWAPKPSVIFHVRASDGPGIYLVIKSVVEKATTLYLLCMIHHPSKLPTYPHSPNASTSYKKTPRPTTSLPSPNYPNPSQSRSKKVVPGIEPGLSESKSEGITITPYDLGVSEFRKFWKLGIMALAMQDWGVILVIFCA